LTAATAHDLRQTLQQCQRNGGGTPLVHPFCSLLHVAGMGLAIWTWSQGWWLLTILAVAFCAQLGHSKLIAFHEAAHGTLNRHRWINEVQGVVLGSSFFVPLSVFRFVHGQHHAYVGTASDPELWPFVDPSVSRTARRWAAFGELALGFFYTPVLFLRGVVRGRHLPRPQAWRIAFEYALCALLWAVVGLEVQRRGWWEGFTVGYLLQAIIAGNLQSLRKFTEHVGMLGDTLLTKTRTVVDETTLGRILSATMLHIDYHGTHHRYARVPYYDLPRMTEHVYDGRAAHAPIHPSYWSAMRDMAMSLTDPRVGAQWLAEKPCLAKISEGFRARPVPERRDTRACSPTAPGVPSHMTG